jgi:transposase-like protein
MSASKEDPEKMKAMPRRRYSDQERAEAMLILAANGGNLSATAIDTGIPYHTLRHWAAGDRHPEAIQMAKEKMPPLADRLEEVVSLLAEGMDDPLKIQRAPLNQIAVALGILIDKVRLLRGQATGSACGVVAEVLDPNTPTERLVVMAGRLGLRTPQDFGASSSLQLDCRV